MKWLSIFMIVGSFSTSVFAQDSVYGTCAFNLEGNDANSSLFNSIGALKRSNVFHAFEINALTRQSITERFVRITPHADNANQYRKYQVALFSSDQASLIEMNRDHIDDSGAATDDYIPYARTEIPGQSIVAIGYGGRNQVGGARVTLDVLGTNAQANDTKTFRFDRNGRSEFSVKYNVHFNYRDLGGEGILGIFSGSVDEEDLAQADIDTHKVKIEVKCNIFLNNSVEESSRDAQKDNSGNTVTPESSNVSEFSESQIIRGPRGSNQ